MSDEETTPDPSPELVADLEAAMLDGMFPDNEVGHTVELLALAMLCVGADALLEHTFDHLPPVPDEFNDAFYDSLRDWVRTTAEQLQEYLKVHGIPRLHLPMCQLACGHHRELQLDASA